MILALITFLATAIAIIVAVGAYRQRPDPIAVPLSLLMISVSIWAFAHGVSKLSPDLFWVLYWTSLQYPGIVTAPLLYLIVALYYAGYRQQITPLRTSLLGVIPVSSLVIVWTNPVHGWFWQSTSVEIIHGAAVLVTENGPWFLIHLGYLYALTLAGLLVFGIAIFTRGPAYRKETTLMFIAGAVPLGANVAFNTGITPIPQIDFTAVSLSIAGILFAVTLFKFELVDVTELARNNLIEQVDDGLIILGPDDQVQYFNPTAQEIIPELAPDIALSELAYPELSSDGETIHLEDETGTTRYFRPIPTTLEDDRGNEAGRIIYLTNVTDLVYREQRVSVLSRVLRHNIRNELTILLGNLEMLEPVVPENKTHHLHTAQERANKILTFAEKARLLEERLRNRSNLMEVNLTPVIDDVLEETTDQFPQADIQYQPDSKLRDGVFVKVVDQYLLERSLVELLSNAIEHSDTETPFVELSITARNPGVELLIADDGPGIPSREREVLRSDRETPLNHVSGLGLWFVKWTITASGGEVEINDSDYGGTAINIAFPPSDK